MSLQRRNFRDAEMGPLMHRIQQILEGSVEAFVIRRGDKLVIAVPNDHDNHQALDLLQSTNWRELRQLAEASSEL